MSPESTLVERVARLARPVGWVLAALGLLFLGHALSRTDLATVVSVAAVWQLLAGAAVYALATLLLAAAWIGLLRMQAGERMAAGPLIVVYARSVLAKYVPGSFFQYLTRHADLVGRRIGQAGIAKANLGEIASQASAALVVVCCGLLPIWPFRLLPLPLPAAALWLVPAAVIGGLAVLAVVFRRRFRTAEILRAAAVRHVAYFVLLEAISLFLLHRAAPEAFAGLPYGVFTLAWLAGYVVIGAPGGLGVREGAYIALLHPHADIGTIAAVALTMRLITVAGDAAFSLAALGYGTRRSGGAGGA